MADLNASKDKVNFTIPVNFINKNTVTPTATVNRNNNGAGKNVQK